VYYECRWKRCDQSHKNSIAGNRKTPVPAIVSPNRTRQRKESKRHIMLKFFTQVFKLFLNGRIPDWSYDGRRIVFVKDRRDICIMDVNGKNLSNITRGQMDVSFVSSLRWSPDDKHILFSDRTAGNDRVYIMDSNGDDWELVIELSDMGGDACWSPDGQKVAFPAQIEPEKYWQIWVINPDGSNLERLTNNDMKESRIDWRDPTSSGVSSLLRAVNTTWGRIKIHP